MSDGVGLSYHLKEGVDCLEVVLEKSFFRVRFWKWAYCRTQMLKRYYYERAKSC